jgi:hypothetical protein
MAHGIRKQWSGLLGVAVMAFGTGAAVPRVEAGNQGLNPQVPAFAAPITTNAAASVSLTSPTANSQFVTWSDVTMAASVKVPKNADAITQVDFFVDSKHVGSARTAPYTFVWKVTNAKSYALSAVGRTVRGAAIYSSSITIIVQGGTSSGSTGHQTGGGTPSTGTPSTGTPTSPSTAIPPVTPVVPVSGMAVLQKESMVYEGTFLLPSQEVNGSRFGYGGTAMAFNRERGTLFLVGHDQHQKAAEITIPALIDPSGTARAQIIQPFYDPTDGRYALIGTRDMAKVGGILPWGNKLIVSMFHYYDAVNSQTRSHFVSGRELSAGNDAQGPFRVGSLKAGYVSGYMAHVPVEWQAALGGPALTGNCCLPVISRTSYGPAVFSFDPDDVGAGDFVPATPLLYYPPDRPLDAWNATSPYFNGTTVITGVVFPEGTQSVLFFGKHGVGEFCYGTTCFPGAGQGTHAAPYVSRVWAYNAADLAAVRAGTKQPFDLRPYAIWDLDLPIGESSVIKGAAYDPTTKRIFISQSRGESPLVHVYRIQ